MFSHCKKKLICMQILKTKHTVQKHGELFVLRECQKNFVQSCTTDNQFKSSEWTEKNS